MGASMVPLVGSGWPWTSVWYRLSTVRSLNWRLSDVYARSDLATTIRPGRADVEPVHDALALGGAGGGDPVPGGGEAHR